MSLLLRVHCPFNGRMNIGNIDTTAASIIHGNKSETLVDVTTLDDYCLANNIAPNFIKLDIEGAEVDALKGAKEVIQKYHPKMAICIYHLEGDFVDIPELILDINPYYEYYIKHSSNYWFETVLLCKPVDYKNQLPELSEGDIEPIISLRDALSAQKNFIKRRK